MQLQFRKQSLADMELYNSLPFAHRFCTIFGITHVTIDRKNGRMYINKWWKLFMLLTGTVFIAATILDLVKLVRRSTEPLYNIILIVTQLSSNRITQITVYWEALRHSSRHIHIFKKLQEIDLKQNCLASISTKQFRLVRRRIIAYSIGYLGVLVLAYFYHFIRSIFVKAPLSFVSSTLFYTTFIVLAIKCYHIVLLIFLVKVQIDRLNLSLRAMCNPLRRSKAQLQTNFMKLRAAQDIYDDIHELTQMICNTFGTFIIINVPVDMFNMTVNLYRFIVTVKTLYVEVIIRTFIVMIPTVWRFSNLAIMCQLAINSGVKSGTYINRIVIDTTQIEPASLVELFSLQMIHSPIAFSIHDLFHINATIFLTLFGVFTTYLIFLLQIS